ncbi:C40 family peptidase [Romboutsia sp. 1001713B170207_170306_H8]|uniref:C40 family peptidase n=1 Tax=Romboutsia sp. 1001713B170207_170306_H8 TaxID=2787112 RepID=UPI001899E88F|nr:SH3 domain-containing protein [Romboutsia sp. 1001713B170207_170306_H8]
MIKKNLIMSMAVTSAVLAINSTEANASDMGIINTSVLNVRSGAGTNYSIIGKLYKGNSVEIISSSNGWYKVKLSNGSTGWVSSQYVDKNNNSVAGKIGTVNTSSLNVRSGAGTNYSIIGSLSQGSTVEIISSSNGWYKVKLSNGSNGWVSSQYIDLNSSSSNNSTNTPSEDTSVAGKIGTVNTSSLNVRSGAGTNYSIIGSLSKGSTVEIISSSSGWYKVKLSNGSNGWVSSQYIDLNSSSSNNSTNTPSEDTSVAGKIGTVNTSSLNVRSGAGTNYSIIGSLSKGSTVEIISSSNGWYKVKLSNGSNGWVSSQYIDLNSSSSNNSTNTPSEDTSTSNKIDAVINLAKQQIGKPYVWGATGPNSFDCSGLTSYVYKNAANISLPRTSSDQSKVGTTISKSNLQPGDLIFSSTNGTGNVSHVGIYIGNNEMIHAPKPGENVQITKINNTYWNNVYLHAKRVL